MRLKVFLEHRFKKTPDGRVWSPIFPYDTWTHYLDVFSGMTLCARVTDVPLVSKDFAPATGDNVNLAGLPHYHGPEQYLRKRGEFKAAVRSLIAPGDAYIVQMPGNVANVAISTLRAAGIPYAIEAVADAWDMFSPGSSKHPLRCLFRRMFAHSMRQQCAQAAASLYVTEHALQRRYPPKEGTPTFHASNVFLAQSGFAQESRPAAWFERRPIRFVCVGSFNLLYKAQDILVKAFAKAVSRGMAGHLSFVGDGIYRSSIEALVRKHAVLQSRVEFLGQLRCGENVREVLDNSHIFVLPSRQEGVPRAALEAMARGLPCIGSNVGGFPEILQPEAIVQPNDVNDFTERLICLAANPTRLAEMSARNLHRASDFHADKLAARRRAYSTAVCEIFTEFWRHHSVSSRSGELCRENNNHPSEITGIVKQLQPLQCTHRSSEEL